MGKNDSNSTKFVQDVTKAINPLCRLVGAEDSFEDFSLKFTLFSHIKIISELIDTFIVYL